MKVIHIRDKTGAADEVYIGRPSIFGNPFPLPQYTREESIRKFQDYFYAKIDFDSKFKEEVHKLLGKTLICYCAPLACHGDVILNYCKYLVKLKCTACPHEEIGTYDDLVSTDMCGCCYLEPECSKCGAEANIVDAIDYR